MPDRDDNPSAENHANAASETDYKDPEIRTVPDRQPQPTPEPTVVFSTGNPLHVEAFAQRLRGLLDISPEIAYHRFPLEAAGKSFAYFRCRDDDGQPDMSRVRVTIHSKPDPNSKTIMEKMLTPRLDEGPTTFAQRYHDRADSMKLTVNAALMKNLEANPAYRQLLAENPEQCEMVRMLQQIDL